MTMSLDLLEGLKLEDVREVNNHEAYPSSQRLRGSIDRDTRPTWSGSWEPVTPR